jgi:RNA polymerase sigma-70 factor (ECF subfamily)
MSAAPPPSRKPPPQTAAVSLEALYQEHAATVFVWAMRYAKGRREWAEDVTHEVFVRAWEHRAWLREPDVKGWLFRVTQNAALSALRRESTFVRRVQTAIGSFWSEPAPTPDALLEKRNALDEATAALNRLPDRERVVMALKTLDGLSQREIASALELSEGYVSKLLSRAEARLQAWGWKVGHDDG